MHKAAVWLAVLTLLAAVLASRAGALLIVVTFPSLVGDVKQIVCRGDRVVSLVPPSVDPHEYQLKPSDVELLEKADVIVSTGHAPFEKRIAELVEEGVVHARLVVVWRAPGVRLLDNPVTGEPDLHMPIYDPRNYIAFIRYLARILSEANPSCASVYEEKAGAVVERVEGLIARAPRVEGVAVADMPYAVYAVEWLGLRVESLLVPEPGLPTTPPLVEKASRLLSRGAWAVVTEPPVAKPSRLLLELAASHGAPVLRVPSPLANGTIPEKLEYIVSQLGGLRAEHRAVAAVPQWLLWVLVVAAASVAFGSLSVLVAARRLYFMAASLPHSSLLAAALAVPIAFWVGGWIPLWATLLAVAAALVFYALIEKGVDVDVASSVFVSASAAGAVAAMYYVLSRYSLEVSLWAYILGDPLLVTPSDALLALGVAAASLAYTLLTYRENICIGLDPEGSRLAGIKVRLYDAATTVVIAAAAVLLLRIVGFVMEHVLLLLPGAAAATAARGMWRVLAYGVLAAVAAGLSGLALALILGAAPAATIGAVMLAIYVASLAAGRRR